MKGRHERLVYSDHVSSYDELLKKDSSFCIHRRNIQSLAIKLYKFFHGLFPTIIKNVLWSSVPNAIKSSKSLKVFKSKIRQWEPDCSCRLC